MSKFNSALTLAAAAHAESAVQNNDFLEFRSKTTEEKCGTQDIKEGDYDGTVVADKFQPSHHHEGNTPDDDECRTFCNNTPGCTFWVRTADAEKGLYNHCWAKKNPIKTQDSKRKSRYQLCKNCAPNTGDVCAQNSDCCDGMSCISGICSDGKEGSSCAKLSDCGQTLLCDGSKCIAGIEPGQACSTKEDLCQSQAGYTCVGKKDAPDPYQGHCLYTKARGCKGLDITQCTNTVYGEGCAWYNIEGHGKPRCQIDCTAGYFQEHCLDPAQKTGDGETCRQEKNCNACMSSGVFPSCSGDCAGQTSEEKCALVGGCEWNVSRGQEICLGKGVSDATGHAVSGEKDKHVVLV